MSEQGLIIASDAHSVTDMPRKFDSRNRQLSVDLEANPEHMQIKDINAGTAFSEINDFNFHTTQETLLTVAHKFKFTPLVLPYFYILSSTVSGDTRVTGYSGDIYILSGTNGNITDGISYEVDATSLRIIHRLDTYGGNTSYVSQAPQITVRVKFYIIPIDIGISLYRFMGDPYP